MKLLLSLVVAVFAVSSIAACSKQEESAETAVAETAEAAAAETADVAVAESDHGGGEEHDPKHERHELMEGVLDGAKLVGPMLRGEADYDAAVAMEVLANWKDVGEKFGALFPEGSEGGEAAPAIWEDREGFDAALVKWQDATNAAIAANPQTLNDARASIGPVFDTCKGCHDDYRIEEED